MGKLPQTSPGRTAGDRRTWIMVLLTLIVLSGIVLWVRRVHAVEGVVRDELGEPIPSAVVRVKTEEIRTTTDPVGRFRLTGFEPRRRVRVTAWADGYYVAGVDAWPWRERVEIRLRRYPLEDDPDYAWVPPAVEDRSPSEARWIPIGLHAAAGISFEHAFLPLTERLTLGCRDCHGEIIYDEWAASAHARGADNPIFLTLYNGTNVAGVRGAGIQFGTSPYYYNKQIVPPAANAAGVGPGFRLDFPETAGNCAACHLPSPALDAPYSTDPNAASGVDARGSHCDFCHKIVDVKLDSESGLPAENRPGVLSLELVRPGGGEQVFFGPYDDVDVGPDTYLPLMKQSQICAPCHNAAFWGVPIYQSFAEWLESPYNDPESGHTCQDCHMRPDGETDNFAPGRGGLRRDPASLPTHLFPGAGDPALLADAVRMLVETSRQGGTLTVSVTIENDRTGHHIPTDSPLRQMILLVEAAAETGETLPLLEGPTLPEWTGSGDPAGGNFAGLPGRAYAKILQDVWTGDTPAASYWNPTRIVTDNRIPAMGEDSTTYHFATPDEGQLQVQVRLLFRRAYKSLADQKGWDAPDILMQEVNLLIPGG